MERKIFSLSKKEYQEMLENSYDGIMIMDCNGYILFANAAYLRLTKSLSVNLIGKNMLKLVEAGLLKKSSALMAMDQKRVVSFYHTFPNGTRVLTTSQPIVDADGQVSKIVTNVRDVTEILKLKEALDDAEQMINQLPSKLGETARHGGSGIVAVSDEMERVFSKADKVSPVDISVLLTGESGVGKEVIAQYIHRHSRRSEKKMISINCSALPPNLLESELFGYSGGSFTGAFREGKPGVFETAKGSTLFLDEIGDTTPDFQAKLLRALETRTINRIGEHRDIAIDVRIVSATNKNLAGMVKEGRFRKDLYYRLNVIEIEIPPLRERQDDIIPLALFFLAKFNCQYKLKKYFSTPVLREMSVQEWPGNVRELKNFVERLTILSEEDKIRLDDYYVLRARLGEGPFPELTNGDAVAINKIVPLHEAVSMAEQKLLRMAYDRYRCTSDMAQRLGVDQSTITRKMKKYEMRKKSKRAPGKCADSTMEYGGMGIT